MKLRGVSMDEETRCAHYHSSLDVIAIKFACCDTYYPCFKCHEELADHPPLLKKRSEGDTLGVLCGACRTELTIDEYLHCHNRCPHCKKPFNPGCKLHVDHYWENDL